MIVHIVLWKILPDDERATKAERAAKITSLLEALRGKIPGLLELEVGHNITPAGDTDISLYTVFEDEAALAAYFPHPLHQAAVAYVSQNTIDRRVVDYVRADK